MEITTLNSWGFRRIKTASFAPKLISTKSDYHFAMLNQLQAIWMKHPFVRAAIDQNKNNTPRKLLTVMDLLKSLGFDHTRQTSFNSFVDQVTAIREQRLSWKLQEVVEELEKVRVLERPGTSDRKLYENFFRFWRESVSHLFSNATFTLEDQKYFAYLDERSKAEEGKFLVGAARYDHVFVDEFQDVNPLDLALIKAISQRSRATLTIVGDDDQAIFEWRGATPEYILNPDKYFEAKFKTYILSVNYRSPANVVLRSQSLISRNHNRVPKKIQPAQRQNASLSVVMTGSVSETLELAYNLVKKSLNKGKPSSRIAIISRKRGQIIPFQIYFASKDIPFCAAEDLHVFLAKSFDRLLELLAIKQRKNLSSTRTQSVNDILALCDLIKRFPLNKMECSSLRSHLQNADGRKLSSVIDQLVNFRGPLKGNNPNGKTARLFADLIKSFLDAESISATLEILSDNFDGLSSDFRKAEDDVFFTDPPFVQLVDYASQYGNDYDRFLDDIDRAKSQLVHVAPFEEDSEGSNIDPLWKRPVHLMTAPRAKGKEFDSVILLDVNDGIWPSYHAQTPDQLEAERRLFYVAFTRAKSNVIIQSCRYLRDRVATPSPYIGELGLDLPR